MELRANPILVGLFTLGVILAGFVFVYWMDRFGEAQGYQAYRVIFTDDVTGLANGAPVMFNGIRVGEISSLGFADDDPTQVVAIIRIAPETPVNVDTRAQAQFQGITGNAFIQLKSGRPDAQPLVQAWGEDSAPIIYAERSTLSSVVESIQSALERIDAMAGQVSQLIDDNGQSVTNTIQNIEDFSEALASNSDEVDTFLRDAAAAARRIDEIGVQLETLAVTLDERVAAVDPELVASTVANVERFTRELAANSDQVTAFIDDARAAASEIETVASKLDEAADNVVEITGAVDPEAVARVVDNIDSFATTMGENTETVEAFFEDAAAVAAQLRETSERVDRLVASVDDMVGGEGGDGFITEITEAARAFRELAGNLDARIARVANDVALFADRGSDDLGAFVADGRRTLSNIDRILRSLESNPAGFITGRGSSVQEFNPRRR